MERILAISDIHGSYDEFHKLLGLVNYDSSKDQLILVGDYVDRGRDSLKTVQLIMELVGTDGAIALRGNHDQMFLDWLKQPIRKFPLYFQNGGIETIKTFIEDVDFQVFAWDSYKKWADEIRLQYPEEVEFLSNLPYYHETDNHIFVHAGINPFLKDWKKTARKDMIWIREEFLNNSHDLNKTIVHGHTPKVNLHGKPDIYFGNKKIGIDGACAYGYQLNCLEIKNGEYNTYSVEHM